MKRAQLLFGVTLLAVLSLVAVTHSEMDTASGREKSSEKSSRLNIAFNDNRITATINGATLNEVVQELGAVTGAEFTLLGNQRWSKQAVFAQVKKEPFEKALDRILRDYSYALMPVAGSKMPKVTVVLQKVRGNPQPQSVLSDTLDGESEIEDEQQIRAKREEDSVEEDNVPYDLDDYASLPVPEIVDSASEQYSEPDQDTDQDATFAQGSAEELDALEERRNQARLERSLSAINSDHSHLRLMAIEELVGLKNKDARVTNALEGVANATSDVSDLERRQAAQALWHHAADLEFSDPKANEALNRLARDGDPEVKAIAERALIDMDRYQHRYQRR